MIALNITLTILLFIGSLIFYFSYKKNKKLKIKLETYRYSIKATPYAIAIYDKNNILIDYNMAYQEIHHKAFSQSKKIISYADLIRATANEFVPKNETEKWVAARVAAQREGDGTPTDRLYPDGRWLRVSKHKALNNAVVGYGIDITELKRRELELNDSKKRYIALTDITPVGIWQLAKSGETLFINSALERILELEKSNQEPLSKVKNKDTNITILKSLHLYHNNELLTPEQTQKVFLEGEEEKHLETEYITHIKKTLLVTRSQLIEDNDGINYYMLVISDTTARKKAEKDIRYLAEHDSLTGLENRAMLNHQLENLLKKNIQFGLVLLDLDHFKDINDTLGHQTGDLLLIEVAKRIKATLRTNDFAYRLGGDEFAVILTSVTDTSSARSVTARIHECFKAPVLIDEHILSIELSAGIALHPIHGKNSQELIKNADIALYHQKGQGRGSLSVFESLLAREINHRKQLEQDLKRALLNTNELHIHFQPQYCLAKHAVSGVEALVRWHNQRTQQWVSPADFIPIAEQCGLIFALDKFVLINAAKQVHAWHLKGYTNLTLASNLSALNFKKNSLIKMVDDALKLSGLKPSCLELEITEGLFLEDQSDAIVQLQHLRNRGIRIAVDDFGTGYSNLGYLNNLPVDCLKIDRSFISNFEKDSYYRSIIKFIIELGLNLKLTIVAEGIETHAQLDALKQLECSHAQGFLLAKPQNAEAIEALLDIPIAQPKG